MNSPDDTHTVSATALQQQPISNELRGWIVDQAKAGIAPEAVLQAMEAAGWAEDVALHAMETTLAAHLAGTAPNTGVQAAAALPPALPVPDPLGAGLTLYLDAGDCRVPVLAAMHKPRIVVLGNLLSDAECEALIEAARPRLARSLTVAVETGGEELNTDRTSEGMFFERGADALIEKIEARIASLLNWPIENGEGLQVLRYPPQAEYKPHYDYFDPQPGRHAGGAEAWRPARGDVDHLLERTRAGRLHCVSRRAFRSGAEARQRRVLQLRPAASVHQDAARRRASITWRKVDRHEVAARTSL